MKKATWVAAAAAVLFAGQSQAQVFTPTFQSTARGSDIGLYLSDGPGELAIEGIWRRNFGTGDLGLRAGFADVGDGALLVGADWRQPLNLQTAPLDLALTLGAQGAFGAGVGIGGQVGVAIGHTFAESGLRITPYVHPRVGVVAGIGDESDTELDVLADVGVDLDFTPNLSLRFGANLGEGADWGIGLALRR